MSEPHDDLIQELGRRRTISEADHTRVQAWLQAHPDAADNWHEDRSLTRLLAQAAPAPVSSNFTAQVLQAVHRETRQIDRQPARAWWLTLRSHPILAPALALTLVAATTSLTLIRYQSAHRMVMTRSVADFSTVAALLSTGRAGDAAKGIPSQTLDRSPIERSIQMLRDFEAISKLRAGQEVDIELLAALK